MLIGICALSRKAIAYFLTVSVLFEVTNLQFLKSFASRNPKKIRSEAKQHLDKAN